MKFNLPLVAVATVLATSALSMSPAQAQSFSRSNSNGAVSGGSTQGPNGGSAGCVGGVRYSQSATQVCGVKGKNGAAYRSSGTSTQGSYRTYGRTYTNPTTGNAATGYSKNVYNAQTHTGSHSANKSTSVNGTSYGYKTNNTYNYAQGSGLNGTSTVQTVNNGNYKCSYASGDGKVGTCTKY